MEAAHPMDEHRWLEALLGQWRMEAECVMGPNEPPIKSTATETVRSLDGLWIVAEGEGAVPGEDKISKSVMSLGYDPVQKKFVGTFIASVMYHLWVYKGSLDATGKILTLDTEGPSFSGDGLAPYQDIIEIVGPDHRRLSSQVLGDDGNWTRFMTANYYRQT